MKQPLQIILDLASLSHIVALRVENRLHSEDQSTTYVHLTGWQGQEARYKWDDVRLYLDVSVSYNTIARLKEHLGREVRAWNDFVKANAAEHEEYLRLKSKFEESPTTP
jgi:uncharacterized protein YfbU (UPF0304 family)